MSEPWEDYQTKESSPWEDYAQAVETPQTKKEEGFFTRVGGDIKNRWNTATAPENYSSIPEENILRVGGQITGLGADVIGQGLRSAYRMIIPKSAQESIATGARNIMSSPVIAEPLKYGMEKYGEFSKEFPNLSKDIEATANIVSLLPMGKGAYEVGKAGKTVAGEVINIGKDIISPITDEGLQKAVRNISVKQAQKAGITPTRARSFDDIAGFNKSVEKAVPEIIKNKEILSFVDDSGNLVKKAIPETVNEWSQVIPQVKDHIINKIETSLKGAEKEGVKVSTQSAVDVIDAIEKSPIYTAMKGKPQFDSTLKTMAEMKNRYKKQKFFTPSEANADIQTLNTLISSRADTLSDFVNLGIVKAQRVALDETISKLPGEFKNLKNTWGALTEIEPRVTRKAVSLSGAQRGLSYWDMASLAEGIAGLATLNPAVVFAAVGTKIAVSGAKSFFSPDRAVKKMFKKAEVKMAQEGQGARSYTGRKLHGLRNTKQTINKSIMPELNEGTRRFNSLVNKGIEINKINDLY